MQEKGDLSKDLADTKLSLEKSQIQAIHQAEMHNIQKVEVEELKR